ncbi:MAG: FAD-dependent oxidoreductase, partial [Myxococcaceae bacterium]
DGCHTCGMSEAGLYCELAPSLAVQRRMAVQRMDGPAPLRPVVGDGPSRGMPAHREPVPETSPCSLQCPLGICIPAYVGAIAAGEPERALKAVTLRAALPSVCSHICHRPCESACVHHERGAQPIAVNELKRYLTERLPSPSPQPQEAPKGPKVAVVGAGPAGLAAARELVRRGYAPTLFDSRERPGGMLEYAIPEHRLPREVLRRDIATVLADGVKFEGGTRLGEGLTLAGLRERGFGAVLLALGAQRATRPPIPGADAAHATDALSFLAEPPSLTGQRVVVVGGGDVAIDAARVSLRRGASSVTLVFPEAEAQMAAAEDTVQAARAEGVVLCAGRAAVEVRERGLVAGRVVGFRRGAEGAVGWDRVEGAEELPATLVIFATGQRPALEGIELPEGLVHPAGRLVGDDEGRTAVPWLFVAGDVATGASTVTAAMAAGVRAAYAIDELLVGGAPLRKPAAPPPRKPVHRPSSSKVGSGPRPVLTAEEALEEAQRCFLCGMCRNCNTCVELLGCPAIGREGSLGTPHILSEACSSCGACVQACPNGAIG